MARSLAMVGLLLLFAHQAAAQTSTCEASEHGMHADGGDNTEALSRTLKECAGQIIHIAHGTYTFRPRGFAVGMNVPQGTSLVGDGSDGSQSTVLQISSSGTFQALLWIRNVSNVRISRLRFEGTAYDSGCLRNLDYGHAIYIWSDSDQTASVDNVEVSDDLFHNFNGQSWLTVNAAPGSPGIGAPAGIVVRGNQFASDADLSGDCSGRRGIEYPVAMLWLHGSDTSAQGLVRNVMVEANTFKAANVKGAVAIWSGTRQITVRRNSILDTGLRLPPASGTELGRYAILVYNSAHEHAGLHPDAVRLLENTIANPVSCGIYVAVGRNLEIVGNRISGQSDRFDATLPKGAIALNHAESVLALRDNELANNYIGIASAGSHINMGANRISASAGGISQKIVR